MKKDNEKPRAEKYPIKPGDRFGKLTVISFNEEESGFHKSPSGRRYIRKYNCVCDCGKEVVVAKNYLRRGTRSCGCAVKGSLIKDLSGQTFNNLDVLHYDDTKERGCGKHAYWICRCRLCGAERSVRSSDLIDGMAKDCGCGKSSRISNAMTNDLSGMTFGHLQVLERDMSVGYESGKHARWLCRCDLCGSVESVSGQMLTRYGKDRCMKCNGGMSMGEVQIAELFDSHNIVYKYDISIGCNSPITGYPLQFDFVVYDYDNLNEYIVEFDGCQHFKKAPQPWERTMSLEQRVLYDKHKDRWCADNGIPLIRIPYTHLNKICFDDLVPSTTAFLV